MNSEAHQFASQYGINIDLLAVGQIVRFGNKKSLYVKKHDKGFAFGDWRQDEHNYCSDIVEGVDQFKTFRPHRVQKADESPSDFPKIYNALRYSDSPLDGSHAYLVSKSIKCPDYVLKLRQGVNSIVLPLVNSDGAITGAQTIGEDGAKRFLLGSSFAKAVHYPIGDAKDSNFILVVEGWATGQTIRQCGFLGLVLCAMSINNMKKVAKYAKSAYPDKIVVLSADNDHQKEANVGLTKAEEYGEELGLNLIYPKFEEKDAGSDWNDFYRIYGESATVEVLDASLAKIEDRPQALSRPKFCDYKFNGLDVMVRKNAEHPYVFLCSYFRCIALLVDPEDDSITVLIEYKAAGITGVIEKNPGFFVPENSKLSAFCADLCLALGAEFSPRMATQVFALFVQQQIRDLEEDMSNMYQKVRNYGWGTTKSGKTPKFYLPRRDSLNAYNLDSLEKKYVDAEAPAIPSQFGEYPESAILEMHKYPYLVLTLIVSLASSVIRFMGLSPQNCIVHLFGGAASGKSTALKIAGSVWGNVKENNNFVALWSSTMTALETISERHSELFLGLDEIKGMLNHKSKSHVITLLAEGRSKDRAVKAQYEYIRAKNKNWYLCFLSVGEHSLDEIINEHLSDGMRRRFLEFKLPSREQGGLLWSPWADGCNRAVDKGVITRLESAMLMNHGKVGERWAEFLNKNASAGNIANGQIWLLRSKLCSFLAESLPKNLNTEYLDILSMLFSVALSMKRAKILSKDLDLRKLFQIYAENLVGHSTINEGRKSDATLVCELVISRLWASNSLFKDLNASADELMPRAILYGYRKRTTSVTVFYLFSSVWENEICKNISGRKPAWCRTAMKEGGYMKLNNDGETHPHRIMYKGSTIGSLYKICIPNEKLGDELIEDLGE